MFELFRARNPHAQSTGSTHSGGSIADLTAEDLPCPWCRAETDEGDVRCSSCGRRFG